MWLPIMTFFALGYEHAIVNMFVIPAGITLGANVTVADWWLWNEIPVILGNIVGGMLFTGMALYVTARKKPALA
jgi:formate/nitrite transporter FocA (FNT family)